MQNRFGLLVTDVMPIYMIIAMNNIITMHFSINCPTIICLPTVCFVSREKPLVKTMAPGSTLIVLLRPKLPCCNYFTFYLLINLPIYHYQIWSLQVTSSWGLTTLLPALGASICSFVCRYCLTRICLVLLLVQKHWFSLREILSATILLHPFSSGKIPTQLTNSRKNF
jgi:hypothetical protein